MRTYTEDSVIKLAVKDNPRKPGTGRHERFEKLRRFDGKTVEKFLKSGGMRQALTTAAREGHVKVVKPTRKRA